MTSISTVLISGVISFMVAFFTARAKDWIDARKLIFQERSELYLELSKHIDKLIRDTSLILNREYCLEVIAFNYRIKLVSGNNTLQQYKNLYEYIAKKNNEYYDWCEKNNPERDEKLFQQMDDGEMIAVVPDVEWEWFVENRFNKIKQLTSPCIEVSEYLNPLYNAMRKELHSGFAIGK